MVPVFEAVFANVLVIPLSGVIGWVTVEEGHRAVVVSDQRSEILIFHHHIGQPAVGLFNERKVTP